MSILLGEDGPQASVEVLGPGGGVHNERLLSVRAGEGQHRLTAQNLFQSGESFLGLGGHGAS